MRQENGVGPIPDLAADLERLAGIGALLHCLVGVLGTSGQISFAALSALIASFSAFGLRYSGAGARKASTIYPDIGKSTFC
jgi:hypothetical protein